MPVTIKFDMDDGGFIYRDEMGAATEFTRSALIEGLTAGTTTPGAERIAEAIDALDAGGFAYFGTTSVDSNLRLVAREITAIPSCTSKMKATLTYRKRAEVLGPVGTWTPTLSGNINQIQTPRDVNGFPIYVSHTFPTDDENHPGQTIEQGASVPQMRPVVEITYRGLINPASIFNEIVKYLGCTNATTWNYGNPGYWLCTNFSASVNTTSGNPDTWLAEVTFQADGDRWDPLAVFIDPATGQQPPNLVNGVGVKRVITQRRADFNLFIPAGTS